METDVVVETPEQIGIRFEVAGFGSRFVAALVDGACMALLLIAAVLVPFLLMRQGADAAGQIAENISDHRSALDGVDAALRIVMLLAAFAVIWGYYIVAELVTDGRSPGKRAVGLRVVRTDGLPIGLSESVIRNLVRVVDFLPGVYGVGMVAVMATARSQRLGDLAAGTIVVKDRAGERLDDMPGPSPPGGGGTVAAPALAALPSPLTAVERDLVERFLDRRLTLEDGPRAALARSIAAPLRARLGDLGIAATVDDETWLSRAASRGWSSR